MLSLVDLFVAKGWDSSYIAYAGALVSALLLLAIFRYLGGDDSADNNF